MIRRLGFLQHPDRRGLLHQLGHLYYSSKSIHSINSMSKEVAAPSLKTFSEVFNANMLTNHMFSHSRKNTLACFAVSKAPSSTLILHTTLELVVQV